MSREVATGLLGSSIAAMLLAMMGAAAVANEVADACRLGATERRVDEERFVPIAGTEQWVTIKGDDCRKPVVLFLHGGPGNTLSPYADAMYGDWQTDFTLVQWDQRGAGRSWGRNNPAGELEPATIERIPLSVEQMTDDGLAVVEYLRRRLGHDRILLTGGSWGSVLGVMMVQRRPELFLGYVGLSQLVNPRINQADSYATVLERARRRDDAKALATLDAIGAPPWTSPRHAGQLRRIVRAYEAVTSDAAPAWSAAAGYTTTTELNAYRAGEDFSYIKYVGLNGDGMASTIALDRNVVFKVPLVLVQGEEDLLTTPAVTRRFVAAIEAPSKRLVTLPRTGHDPNAAMLAAQRDALRALAK